DHQGDGARGIVGGVRWGEQRYEQRDCDGKLTEHFNLPRVSCGSYFKDPILVRATCRSAHAHLSRGSSASRRPSPSRLNDITVRKIARPGKIASQGALLRKRCAALSMLPHEGSGGCWPRPRNDRLASEMIAVAIESEACTARLGRMFGRICTTAMRQRGLPTMRAASTKSSTLTAITWPRVSRTKIGVVAMPIAIMALPRLGPRNAASAIARIR